MSAFLMLVCKYSLKMFMVGTSGSVIQDALLLHPSFLNSGSGSYALVWRYNAQFGSTPPSVHILQIVGACTSHPRMKMSAMYVEK